MFLFLSYMFFVLQNWRTGGGTGSGKGVGISGGGQVKGLGGASNVYTYM
jgi:hypothetical protein